MRAVLILLLLALPVTGLAQSTPEALVLHMTRAEASLLLLSQLGTPVPVHHNNGRYPDVLEGHWYTKFILEAAERGIVDRNPPSGLMRPHQAVTRAEFLKMLTTAFGIAKYFPHTYADVAEDAWFNPYAVMAQRYTLFALKDNPPKLHPSVPVTHREAASAVQRILIAFPNLRTTSLDVYRRPIDTKKEEAIIVHIGTRRQVKSTVDRSLRSSAVIGNSAKDELLIQVNEARQTSGLEQLRFNEYLLRAAQKHAEDMWHRRYFSHVTPEGVTYLERIREAGYLDPNNYECTCTVAPCSCTPAFAVGENIAQGQLTPTQVLSDWMRSPQHRRNILNPQFTEIGIGIFGNIWVQNFGNVEFR